MGFVIIIVLVLLCVLCNGDQCFIDKGSGRGCKRAAKSNGGPWFQQGAVMMVPGKQQQGTVMMMPGQQQQGTVMMVPIAGRARNDDASNSMAP